MSPSTSGQMADRVLGSPTENGNSSDTPYLEAVGNAAFGDLTGAGDYVLAAPTAGITRAADIILTDHQLNAQDAITAWTLSNVASAYIEIPDENTVIRANDMALKVRVFSSNRSRRYWKPSTA